MNILIYVNMNILIYVNMNILIFFRGVFRTLSNIYGGPTFAKIAIAFND